MQESTVKSKSKKYHDILPRILEDPSTGIQVLEFVSMGGKRHTADRRTIFGCLEADLRTENGEITNTDVGCVNTVDKVYFTEHSYEDLCAVLYPNPKETVW